jgi:hypothetical protein
MASCTLEWSAPHGKGEGDGGSLASMLRKGGKGGKMVGAPVRQSKGNGEGGVRSGQAGARWRSKGGVRAADNGQAQRRRASVGRSTSRGGGLIGWALLGRERGAWATPGKHALVGEKKNGSGPKGIVPALIYSKTFQMT